MRWIAASIAILLAPAAAAAELGVFDDWSAFTGSEGGKKVCYMGGVPTKEAGDYARRGEVYLLVTHRPADNSRDVVSFTAGYTYKPGSEAEVVIGGHTFRMYTQEGNAWASGDTDRALVAAMKAGATMVVKGASSRGTPTTDTFSLKGFSAAYEAIGKACGIK